MQQNHSHQSGRFNPRFLLAVALCLIGGLLATLAFAPAKPTTAPQHGPMLAFLKTDLSPRFNSGSVESSPRTATPAAATSASSITFGHPIIAGIGGTGFEESIRIDPTLNAK